MIDLVITNVSKSLKNICRVPSDLRDVHQMVCFATKLKAPVKKKRHILFRSYRKFEEKVYVHDLSNIPYEIYDDAWMMYICFMKALQNSS